MQTARKNDVKPSDVLADRFRRLARMNRSQRCMYCFITERSSRGLWTTYEDCLDAGIGLSQRSRSERNRRASIRKRVSELIQMDVAGVRKRVVNDVVEFCV